MGSVESVKNLVARTRKDQWACILTRQPDAYQIPEIGALLIELTDHALFERRYPDAIRVAVIFEKWADRNTLFAPKAKAVLGAVMMSCGKIMFAEELIMAAIRIAGDSIECLAECHRRLGTLLLYQDRATEALGEYSTSIEQFEKIDSQAFVMFNLVNRGAGNWILGDYEHALQDLDRAIRLYDEETMPRFYLTAASINMVSVLTSKGRTRDAQALIEEIQADVTGKDHMERVRLILRWLRALLLDIHGERKIANQILDRVDDRMAQLNMYNERRVLLADKARLARFERTISTIAQKALAIEQTPSVAKKIEEVLKEPTPQKIQEWRSSIDTYLPPFLTAA